ncbi:MAG: DeoR/GlpR family DNA-binding transcription regulator [Clostridia bacterium]
MIPYVRRQRILEQFEKKELVYVENLVQALDDISVSTIRRDLRTLANEGQIVLLRGGAAKLKVGSFELPIQTKQLLNIELKDKIAKYAASLVNDGEVIYIDSGSTPLRMMKYLKNKEITVVTSNTQVLNELADTKVTCIILGGEITKTLASIVGPITDGLLSTMFFDKAFIGASGYSLQSGINTPDSREANKKKIVKNNSKETYVLIDSSKTGKVNFCKAFEINECTIITDESNEILEKYAKFVVI